MFGHKEFHSFLLRLWQIKDDDRSEWNFSLENTFTREKQNFVDLQTLMEYLTQITQKKQVERQQPNKEEK